MSIEEGQNALAVDPDLGPAYTNLADSYFMEGRMKNATNVAAQTSARGFNPPEILVLRFAIALAAGAIEGMKRTAPSAL